MKDLVREYGKIAAFFAAAAFVLSLLIGLVSRNPFGTVLLRALLLGVLFALLGAGFSFVVKKYLPELLNQPSRQPQTPEGKGRTVDIVLPDENPHASAETSGDEGEAFEDAEAADILSATDESGAREESVASAGPSVEDFGAREGGGTEEPSPVSTGRTSEETYEEEPAEVIAEDGAGAAAGPEPEIASQGSPGMDNLDTLPDIGDLDSISGAGTTISQDMRGAAPRPSPRSRPQRPGDAMGDAMSGQDPESLAKAIRTVLRRDEKG